jgi:hypothetical protein
MSVTRRCSRLSRHLALAPGRLTDRGSLPFCHADGAPVAKGSKAVWARKFSTIAAVSPDLVPRPSWVAVIDRLATSFSPGADADASLLHASHVDRPRGQAKTGREIRFQPSRRDENLLVVPVFPAPRCWATIKRP